MKIQAITTYQADFPILIFFINVDTVDKPLRSSNEGLAVETLASQPLSVSRWAT